MDKDIRIIIIGSPLFLMDRILHEHSMLQSEIINSHFEPEFKMLIGENSLPAWVGEPPSFKIKSEMLFKKPEDILDFKKSKHHKARLLRFKAKHKK